MRFEISFSRFSQFDSLRMPEIDAQCNINTAAPLKESRGIDRTFVRKKCKSAPGSAGVRRVDEDCYRRSFFSAATLWN
jgi:hypothetical protein